MTDLTAASRITRSNSWLLRMVLPVRWGRWLTGALIFSVLFCLFVFVGGIFDESTSDRPASTTVGFFCFILAYIIPIHHLIVERSLRALDQLEQSYPDETEAIRHFTQRILRKSAWWYAGTLSLGLISGTVHNMLLLDGSDLVDVLTDPSSLLTFTLTTAIWVVMKSVIWSLVENAALFNRPGPIPVQTRLSFRSDL